MDVCAVCSDWNLDIEILCPDIIVFEHRVVDSRPALVCETHVTFVPETCVSGTKVRATTRSYSFLMASIVN
jgi:hypothetical protein